MKANDREGITKVHNVRFYNLVPRSIHCISVNKSNGKLALSRNDATLEIWDITYAPFLEKTIFNDSSLSIEALGWSEDRLFSVGFSGEVIEWDLSNMKKKHAQPVTGSATWCLDINLQEDCIAVGTEEGYLNLFDIIDYGLTYKMLFDKQEGRILCCKFDVSGEYIVTGSVDVIRIWNTKTGHAIHKMTLSRIDNKHETIVWSLQVLNDFTIISGDSRGYVTTWDGKMGSQVQSIQASKVDILAVAVSEDENTLAVSGIDSLIRIYSLTTIKKEEQSTKKWVKFWQRHIHDHDIKALACYGDRIISGGVDGYLGISSYSKMKQDTNKYGPFLQSPCAAISSTGRLILLRYTNYLELWRLGVPEDKAQLNDDDDDDNNVGYDSRKLFLLEEGPEKLIELRSYNDENIVCSSISPNGCILIYSTLSTIRIFSVTKCAENSNESIKLIRIKDLPEQMNSPCHRIVFSYDSKTLFLVRMNRQIDVFNILPTTETTNEIDYAGTIDASKSIKEFIHLAVVSNCGKYFIAAGTCKAISVWMKHKKRWQHYMNLPKYVLPAIAIAIHPNKSCLVAAFSDCKIFEYDLDEMRFTCSSNQALIPKMHSHCINGIVLDPRNENVIILHNDTFLFVLSKDERNQQQNKFRKNKNKMIKTDEQQGKEDEEEAEEGAINIPKLKLKFKKAYEHIVHLSWLTEEEIVVVGVNPVTLIEHLPGAFRRKKFGTA